MKKTLGQFLAEKLPGSQLEEWPTVKDSFDFEIHHKQETLADSFLQTWAETFFSGEDSEYRHKIDTNLTGKVRWDGVCYILVLSNFPDVRKIKGTLMPEP